VITETSVGTTYLYTGREWDPEAQLYYYRARWYDPQAKRFISEDPIALEGGINLYAYVGNNPINKIDPFGESGTQVCNSVRDENGNVISSESCQNR
jgi:RHS repeat-associated protein